MSAESQGDGSEEVDARATLSRALAALVKSQEASTVEWADGLGEEVFARIEKAALSKVLGVGGETKDTTETSNVLPSNDDVHTLFTMAGALFPPYDPEMLVTLYEHSNALRPNVEAYSTNIESFGWRLEPVVDLKSAEAPEKIGDAIFLERLRDQQTAVPGAVPQASYPTSQEIAARMTEVASLMRLEHAQTSNFFEHCCADSSFTELRCKTRVDYEVTGNAYWEVLRNANGEVTQFVYVPAYSVRLIPIEHRHHEYTIQQRVSVLEYEPTILRRRFRRFVQVVLDRIVHFKEFGDPRVISRKTGRTYPSVEQLQQEDPNDGPATELIHFKVHSPRSPYGVPRWIGVLLAVLGSRSSEEVNFLYFDNKAVPPLAVMVSGGKLAEASVKRLESYVKDNIKGKENYHRILILEAEPAGPGGSIAENGRVRIELRPLADAQEKDALFQNYDERNIDKVGSAFRVPRLLRGDVRDFNRSTADASLAFAEIQVFQPERERFDDRMNRQVLTEKRVRFWKFMSQSPVNRDPVQVATMATMFGNAGAITPNEMRKLAGEALNMEFPQIEEAWGDQPFPLTLQAILPPDSLAALAGTPPAALAADGSAPTVDEAAASPTVAAPATPAAAKQLQHVAASLLSLRSALGKAAAAAFDRKTKANAADDPAGTVVIRLPKSAIDALFEPEA